MANGNQDVIEIDLLEIAGLLIHKIWMIILAGILGATIGFSVSKFAITPKYQSTTKVYMINKQKGDALTYSDTQLATMLSKDYRELVSSRFVLEGVIEQLGLDMSYASLKNQVSVTNASDTRIVSISVQDSDPAKAQMIADAVREIAAERIKEVMDIEAVNVVDVANLPISPVSPSVMKWTAMAGLFGAVVCAGVIILIFLMDDTIKSSEDIEKYLGLSTLALVPMNEGQNAGKKKTSLKRETARGERFTEDREPRTTHTATVKTERSEASKVKVEQNPEDDIQYFEVSKDN